MLERSRVFSYILSAAAALAVLIALRVPHSAAGPRVTSDGWVRVDVVPSFEHTR